MTGTRWRRLAGQVMRVAARAGVGALLVTFWAAGAAQAPGQAHRPTPTPAPSPAEAAWLFGERHDHPDHAAQTAQVVHELARTGRLRALVIEMAERGRSTRELGPEATVQQVREALGWQDAAWPWIQYAPLVMAAVRAGVPVVGGNLPRAQVRAAMAEAAWDARVPTPVRERLVQAVREGHCDLLPASQWAPMARVQIARDEAMARAVAEAADQAPREQVVVLHAGAVHVSRATGVPVHLARLAPRLALRVIGYDSAHVSAAEAGFDEWRPARHEPPRDHCAELRARLARPQAPNGASAPSVAPAVPGVPAASAAASAPAAAPSFDLATPAAPGGIR